jgi:hypothetical protein
MLEIVRGWELREALGGALFEFSAHRRTSEPLSFIPLLEKALRYRGLYRRPHEIRDGRLWCPISEAPLSTTFANSRFLLPWIAHGPWVLYCDGSDMLFQADPAALFELANDDYAVMVVKREHVPREEFKKDDQIQTRYPRKNWSSVILWNLEHPGNLNLTIDMVNELPGRDLHRFCWLEDDEIGELPAGWNHLVGVDADDRDAKLVHFTNGLPVLDGHRHGRFADLWRKELSILNASKARLAA